VFVLFSGYDDDGQSITNYWISNQADLGAEGTKKFTDFLVDGYIWRDQSFDIYLQYDNADFVMIGSISGQEDYVDIVTGTVVGASTVGLQVVGGGSVPNAYHFRRQFRVASPLFETVTVKFIATGVGALQINEYQFIDIRSKTSRSIPNYNK
jgi:hypothetical protein